MRKIILDLALSLDGFIEGLNGEVDWCVMDDDMGFDSFLSSIDSIFYGRISYDLWGNHQPPYEATEAEKAVWKAVHSKQKFVFSGKPQKSGDAVFISSDIRERVAEIRSREGKDIWLYGGAKLIATFINLGLIDQYRLSIHPTVLGSGKPLFENLGRRLDLKLTDSRRFRSGVIQLIYEPVV